MNRRIVSAEEQDAFTGWRKYMYWKRGQLRKVKRRAAKRERREARQQIRSGDRDA